MFDYTITQIGRPRAKCQYCKKVTRKYNVRLTAPEGIGYGVHAQYGVCESCLALLMGMATGKIMKEAQERFYDVRTGDIKGKNSGSEVNIHEAGV